MGSMHSIRGFSLVELSVVLVIVGVLTVSALTVGASVADQQRRSDNREHMKKVEDSIISYFRTNGRMPCVAQSDALPTAAAAGVQIHNGDCFTTTTTPSGTRRVLMGALYVRVGAIPYKTLGLSESDGNDAWKNRYTYMVVENATEATPFAALSSTHDGIRINDETGNTIYPNALFAIISHGKDGRGTYKPQTGVKQTCGTATKDSQNCINHANNAVTLIDASVNQSSIEANVYDDYMLWKPKYLLGSGGSGGGAASFGKEQVTNSCPGADTCSVSCPAGKVVLQGGCAATSAGGPELQASYPTSSTQWRCNMGATVTTFTVYAICAEQ